MIRSMNTAVQGMRTIQTSLDVIANNLANVDTVSFKGSRTDFKESYSNLIRPPTPDAANNPGASGIALGNGVSLAATTVDFRQGPISNTGIFTDLALEGEGFFVVRNPVTNEVYVTRAGNFRLDSNGFLVTDQGLRVQGINNPGSDPVGVGDIRFTGNSSGEFPNDFTPAAAYDVDSIGQVNAITSDGSRFVRGRILIQRFNSPQNLVNVGGNLFSNFEESGAAKPAAAGGLNSASPILAGALKPGETGTARIRSGALEVSNVDMTREFSQMIISQRAFQANSRMISTSDEILVEVVNLKR